MILSALKVEVLGGGSILQSPLKSDKDEGSFSASAPGMFIRQNMVFLMVVFTRKLHSNMMEHLYLSKMIMATCQ